MAGKKKYVILEERHSVTDEPYWKVKQMGFNSHDDVLLMTIFDSSLLAPIAQIMESQNFNCHNPEKIDMSFQNNIPVDIDVEEIPHLDLYFDSWDFTNHEDRKLLLSIFDEGLIDPIQKALCSEQKEWDRVHLPNQNDENLER
jgi:hypothetical protein